MERPKEREDCRFVSWGGGEPNKTTSKSVGLFQYIPWIGQPHLLHRVKKDWKRGGVVGLSGVGGWSQKRRQQKARVYPNIFPRRRIPIHLQHKKYIYPPEYGPFYNTSDTKSLGADMYVGLAPEVTQTLPEVNHNQYQYILVLCHQYIPRE